MTAGADPGQRGVTQLCVRHRRVPSWVHDRLLVPAAAMHNETFTDLVEKKLRYLAIKPFAN